MYIHSETRKWPDNNIQSKITDFACWNVFFAVLGHIQLVNRSVIAGYSIQVEVDNPDPEVDSNATKETNNIKKNTC